MGDTPPSPDKARVATTPSGQILATRCFTPSDQLEFARLSGDYNPVHLDEIAARRTLSGEPLVHGVHSVIWALDALASIGLPIAQVKRLNVRFTKFLFLDTPIEIRVQQQPEKSLIRVRLVIGNVVAGLVVLYLAPQRVQNFGIPSPSPVIDTLPETPNAPTLPEMATLAGRLLPPAPASEWRRLYPHAAAALTAQRLSGLAQLSHLVGMVCPGLHSIFTGFTVDMVDDSLSTVPGSSLRRRLRSHNCVSFKCQSWEVDCLALFPVLSAGRRSKHRQWP